jgi:hypothetical protein
MKIYSAFPGTGKTHFCKTTKLNVLDLAPSNFRNNYPYTYVEYIKSVLNDKTLDMIFIPADKELRELLNQSNIEYSLIYPKISLLYEYLDRYRQRGSSETFIKIMKNNWDHFITELQNEESKNHIVLKTGEYISDVIYKFLKN